MDHSSLSWRKSSRSGNAGGENSNCVEVAWLGVGAAVRDSKSPSSPFLTFPGAPWDGFLRSLIDS